ncbi:type II secretion system protein GspD [Comamonadaceae bacterium OH2545_COT-014]|nr:type II secretion system protein GspD [Comamonadaceae bacterium OH2545_COT-014]
MSLSTTAPSRASGLLRPPLAAACLALCCMLAMPPVALAQKKPASVTLDFANAEIDAVARTMATLTGRNVVVDPRVKGSITLTSTTPVTPGQAMRLFASQLRTQGFALVEADGMTLVVPEAEAKLRSASVSAGAARGGSGQVQTQIFRLSHENAANLVPILRPLISPNNTINVNPGSNALVITDYDDNLRRLARIIAALDVSNATGVEVVPLKHAVASDLAPLVLRLAESGSSGSAPPLAPLTPGQPVQVSAAASGSAFPTTLIPEPRSNALIIRAANPARLALVKTLIQQLDQPPATRSDGGSGNIHVVYLKNADAAKLAVTLRAALAALPGQSGASSGGAAAAPAPASTSRPSGGTASTASSGDSLSAGPSIDAAGNNQPSTGGQIQADPATNSLIISAPEPVYRELRAVIDKLDQRRAQVYIESLIAEVNMDRAADFGIQWQLFGKNENNFGIAGTNYSTNRATQNGLNSTNIFDIASAILDYSTGGNIRSLSSAKPNTGFNLALGSRAFGILANFIQSTGTGNVLSTPTILTLDNEEAKIIVGQNVPFITGSYTNGNSGNTLNPFQTYDRQDVGLTLKVRPQINENGTIKMVIYQESSNLQGATDGGFITRKRAIESSVLIEDGAIIALGGLLEDQYTDNTEKVPGLGDIPFLGNLFKSQNRMLRKTNLMIFLRPTIIRDSESATLYSASRYESIRSRQAIQSPLPSSILQINESPILPSIEKNPWIKPITQKTHLEFQMPASGENNHYEDTSSSNELFRPIPADKKNNRHEN